MNFKWQLYGFASIVVMLLALLLWTGQSSWKELSRLRADLRLLHGEGFHLAKNVAGNIQALNSTLLRSDLLRNPAERANFQSQTQAMSRWIRTNKTSVTTEQQLDLFNQIESAFDLYLRKASVLGENQPPGADSGSEPAGAGVQNEAAHLIALAKQLTDVEEKAVALLGMDCDRACQGLQRYLVTSVVIVLVLGLAATRWIYLASIAPLSAKLVASRSIMEQREKLASLGTLAAGVAHEIRNPLTAINIRLHGLEKTLTPGSSEYEDAIVIHEETRRLESIVRNFLEFARPAKPQLRPVTAAVLFGKVKKLLGYQLQQSGIQLNLELSGEIWVEADVQQMEQVLINLIQNAADSVERGGSITLRATKDVRSFAGGQALVSILEVADTGNGIAPEIRDRLFDPFFSTKEGNTGLGLSVAAHIVEGHGGELQFQTKMGRGTTFSIVLPQCSGERHDAKA